MIDGAICLEVNRVRCVRSYVAHITARRAVIFGILSPMDTLTLIGWSWNGYAVAVAAALRLLNEKRNGLAARYLTPI